MSMVNLRPHALQDLEDIWLSNYRLWGAAPADDYILKLYEHLILLAQNPALGMVCSHIRFGYRKSTYKKHTIFYQETYEGIDVVRILDKDQDIS